MFQKFSLICPTKFKFFLYPNRYSPILVLIELKQIDFIEKPVLDFKIVEICLSLIMLFLMILRSLIRNVGNGFPVPNGPIIFISLKKSLLRASEEISAS